MRRAARVDDNHREVIAALRQVGASVMDLSRVGAGCPDICAGFRGRNILIEIKDGNKPPSARKLTDAQDDWHAQWNGSAYVVTSAEEAVETILAETQVKK